MFISLSVLRVLCGNRPIRPFSSINVTRRAGNKRLFNVVNRFFNFVYYYQLSPPVKGRPDR